MLGPDPKGLGGISRVVDIWMKNDFFFNPQVRYIATTGAAGRSKLFYALKAFLQFIFSLGSAQAIYIHSAAYTSFARKSIFILPAIICKKRIILHIHPTDFYIFLKSTKGFLHHYFFFLLGHVKAFIVLSEEMKNKMLSIFPNTNTYVMKNAINVKEMAKSYDYQRENNYLLYLGWYIKEKGVYDLIDAIGMLVKDGHTVKLTLYGNKGRNQLKEYVSENGLADYVSVNGWIGFEKKLGQLYRCTALVLPSHSEGIPNVILEAMATQTPIISTCVGGLKEILRDNYNAIITEDQNPKDLSEKIKKCLDNKILRESIAGNAYEEVKEQYDVNVIKDRYLEIMNEVLVTN